MTPNKENENQRREAIHPKSPRQCRLKPGRIRVRTCKSPKSLNKGSKVPLADLEAVVGRQILGAMGSQMGPELRVGATQTPRALAPPLPAPPPCLAGRSILINPSRGQGREDPQGPSQAKPRLGEGSGLRGGSVT